MKNYLDELSSKGIYYYTKELLLENVTNEIYKSVLNKVDEVIRQKEKEYRQSEINAKNIIVD